MKNFKKGQIVKAKDFELLVVVLRSKKSKKYFQGIVIHSEVPELEIGYISEKNGLMKKGFSKAGIFERVSLEEVDEMADDVVSDSDDDCEDDYKNDASDNDGLSTDDDYSLSRSANRDNY